MDPFQDKAANVEHVLGELEGLVRESFKRNVCNGC
jgi:hypothetical protein